MLYFDNLRLWDVNEFLNGQIEKLREELGELRKKHPDGFSKPTCKREGCNNPVEYKNTGRIPDFCSSRCRLKHWRETQ